MSEVVHNSGDAPVNKEGGQKDTDPFLRQGGGADGCSAVVGGPQKEGRADSETTLPQHSEDLTTPCKERTQSLKSASPKAEVVDTGQSAAAPTGGQQEAAARAEASGRTPTERRNRKHLQCPLEPTGSVREGHSKFNAMDQPSREKVLSGIVSQPEKMKPARLPSPELFLSLISLQYHEFDPEVTQVVERYKNRLLDVAQKKPSSIHQKNTDPVKNPKSTRQVQFSGTGEPERKASYSRMAFPDDVNKLIATVGPWVLYCGLGIEGLLTFMVQTAIEYKAFTSSDLLLPTFEDVYTLLRDSTELEAGRSLFVSQLLEVVKSRLLTYLMDSKGQDKSQIKPFFFQLGIELKHDRHRDRASQMARLHLSAGDNDRPPVPNYTGGLETKDYIPPAFGIMLSRAVAALLVANSRAMDLGRSIEVRASTFAGDAVHLCTSTSPGAADPQGYLDIFCFSQKSGPMEPPKPPADMASYGFLWASVPSTEERMAKKMECSTIYASCPVKNGFPQTDATPAYFKSENVEMTIEQVYTVETEDDPKSSVSKMVQNTCKDSNLVNYETTPRAKRGNDRGGFTSKVKFTDPTVPEGHENRTVIIDPWKKNPQKEACTSKKAAEHQAAQAFLEWFREQKQFQGNQVSKLKKLDELLAGEPGMEIQVANTHEVGPDAGFHSRITIWNERKEKVAEVASKDLLCSGEKFTDLQRAVDKVVSVMIEKVTRLIKERRIRPERKKPLPLSTTPVHEEKKRQNLEAFQAPQALTQAHLEAFGGLHAPQPYKPLSTNAVEFPRSPQRTQLSPDRREWIAQQITQPHVGLTGMDSSFMSPQAHSPKVYSPKYTEAQRQTGTMEVPRKDTVPLPFAAPAHSPPHEATARGRSARASDPPMKQQPVEDLQELLWNLNPARNT